MSSVKTATDRGSSAGTPARLDVTGSLAVLLAAACWGTSGIFVRFVSVSSEITALALAFWRDLFSFVVLLAVVLSLRAQRSNLLRVQRRDLPWLLGFGSSLGVFHVFWNLGVMLNGPAVATVQQAAMPAIVAVAAWLIWRESLTWNKILAIALTFAGTVLVSDLDALGRAQVSLAGLLVGLGIPLTYAAWTLFGKKVREHYGPMESLAFGFGWGALLLLPFQFFTPQPWPVPPVSWLWFTCLILVSTALAFSMYAFGLGRLPASVASILAMTEIPIVTVYAYVLLDERMTADQVLGAILVVSGALLLSWRRRETAPESDAVES